MDEQLNHAPCGYFMLNEGLEIVEVNETMVKMLHTDIQIIKHMHIHELLTRPAKIYFQTYFMPVLSLHGKVDEMYTTLETKKGKFPVLLNAVKRKNHIECVVVKMEVRDQYEDELIQAKKNVERILNDTDKAYNNLLEVMKKFEIKRDELTTLNKELSELAITDSLTNLKNRRFLDQRIEFLLEMAEFEHVPLSVIMIDIDHFKNLNDRYGHLAGDEVLKQVAQIFLNETLDNDIVVRIGGEEFLIVLPSASLEEGTQVGEKLRSSIENYQWSYQPLTISLGVTAYQEKDELESLLKRADEAMYVSKTNGRNRLTVYESSEK